MNKREIVTTDVNKLLERVILPREVRVLPESVKNDVLTIIQDIYKFYLNCVTETYLTDEEINECNRFIDELESVLEMYVGFETSMIIIHSILETLNEWVELLIEWEQYESVVNLKKLIY